MERDEWKIKFAKVKPSEERTQRSKKKSENKCTCFREAMSLFWSARSAKVWVVFQLAHSVVVLIYLNNINPQYCLKQCECNVQTLKQSYSKSLHPHDYSLLFIFFFCNYTHIAVIYKITYQKYFKPNIESIINIDFIMIYLYFS